MSKPNYIRHDKSPISVIIHAESLANYIYQITNNERQFGKVFRYSLSADMRNVATNIVKSISKAVEIRPRYKGEYKRRMKFRLEAYESIVEMKALIRLAKNVANIRNFEHLVRLLDEVITSYKTWASSDARKFKYLPSKKEFYKRLEEQNHYRKMLKAQEESMKRDEEGFISLRRKAGK